MKRVLAVLIVLGLAVGLWFWQPWQGKAGTPQYRLGQVERGDLAASVSASGTLSALVTVQVGSQVSGQIAALYADFNSTVTPGQVIARLDSASFASRVAQAEADLAAAQGNLAVAQGTLTARGAEVKRAEVALDEAARTLTRRQELVARGFVSTAELDSARAAHDGAREALALAQANLEVAGAQLQTGRAQVAQKAAALGQARVELSHTVIRSPVAGTVISRNVDVGQTVAASLQAPVLFSIAQDLSRMEVNVAVDEADVGRIAPGQAVRFGVDAFPGAQFQGTVSQIRKAPQVTNNVVTYSVMATVANPDLKLLPGMTANARILGEAHRGVLKVANEALRFRPTLADGSPVKSEVRAREAGPGLPGRVWVLREGKPTPVNLRIGLTDGRSTEILQGELSEGSEVILGLVETANPTRRPATRPF